MSPLSTHMPPWDSENERFNEWMRRREQEFSRREELAKKEANLSVIFRQRGLSPKEGLTFAWSPTNMVVRPELHGSNRGWVREISRIPRGPTFRSWLDDQIVTINLGVKPEGDKLAKTILRDGPVYRSRLGNRMLIKGKSKIVGGIYALPTFESLTGFSVDKISDRGIPPYIYKSKCKCKPASEFIFRVRYDTARGAQIRCKKCMGLVEDLEI